MAVAEVLQAAPPAMTLSGSVGIAAGILGVEKPQSQAHELMHQAARLILTEDPSAMQLLDSLFDMHISAGHGVFAPGASSPEIETVGGLPYRRRSLPQSFFNPPIMASHELPMAVVGGKAKEMPRAKRADQPKQKRQSRKGGRRSKSASSVVRPDDAFEPIDGSPSANWVSMGVLPRTPQSSKRRSPTVTAMKPKKRRPSPTPLQSSAAFAVPASLSDRMQAIPDHAPGSVFEPELLEGEPEAEQSGGRASVFANEYPLQDAPELSVMTSGFHWRDWRDTPNSPAVSSVGSDCSGMLSPSFDEPSDELVAIRDGIDVNGGGASEQQPWRSHSCHELSDFLSTMRTFTPAIPEEPEELPTPAVFSADFMKPPLDLVMDIGTPSTLGSFTV